MAGVVFYRAWSPSRSRALFGGLALGENQVDLFSTEPDWLKKARQVYEHFEDHYEALTEASKTAVRESDGINIGTVRYRTGEELRHGR
jgi:hypothetical protein